MSYKGDLIYGIMLHDGTLFENDYSNNFIISLVNKIREKNNNYKEIKSLCDYESDESETVICTDNALDEINDAIAKIDSNLHIYIDMIDIINPWLCHIFLTYKIFTDGSYSDGIPLETITSIDTSNFSKVCKLLNKQENLKPVLIPCIH